MPKVLISTENMPYQTWLEWRRKGIGGSDASIICGVNKYKSPIELWMEKTDQIPHQQAGEAAYWGTQLESIIRTEFTKRTDIKVTQLNQITQHDEYPFMLANLDGICTHTTYGECIFEAKTASAYKINEWESGIPDEYMLQIQHYISVMNYGGAFVAVLIGGNTFKWQFIQRDDELIAMLIELESEFWRCVQTNVPPKIDGSDASAKFLNERFPSSIPHSKIMLPKEAVDLIIKYKSADKKAKEFIAEKQFAENSLKEMLGENEIGETQTHIVLWKSTQSSTRKSTRRFSIKTAI